MILRKPNWSKKKQIISNIIIQVKQMFKRYRRFKNCIIQEKYKNHSCIEQHKKRGIL